MNDCFFLGRPVLGAAVVTAVALFAILPAAAETAPVPPSPASAPATPSPIAAGPVVTKVREQMAQSGFGKILAKDDVAAAVAFYNERAEPIWLSADAISPKAKSAVNEIGKAADYGLDAKAFDLPQIADTANSVEQKADLELKLTIAALTYARHARGGRINPQNVSRLIDQNPPLKETKTVLADIVAASDPAAYLRGLHPKHEQFERLRQALLKARSSGTGDKDIKRLEINMERWRWLPEDLGRVYVINNIPEFMSRTLKDGKPVFEEKIIVGQTSWPTPVFSADMKTVVFNPSWGMPDGIKAKELQPRLKQAGGGGFFEQLFGGSSGGGRVLRAYKLQVTLNGRPVDPDSVDWSSVDIRKFHFSQPPGAENPLGKVKFLFPNDHDVYMHDTPERTLFSKSYRALSHGCMRLQNPKRFAEVLLGEDKGWSAEKVNSQYSGGGEVPLDKPVPVHVVYLTASIDDAGQLKTFGDLYGLDSRMSSALYGAATRFEPETAGAKDEKPESADATADDTPVKKVKNTKKIVGKGKPEKPTGPLGGDLSSVVSGGLAN